MVECLRSGWLTTGRRTARFEQDFVKFLGGGIEAVAVSSATAGLEVALSALEIGPGDEVITTDYTFTATAMSVVHIGATPVLVDIDPRTFNIDPNRVEAAITPRTKAIIPVHFAGLACDMAAITDIARRHSLRVIEDAAHALPTRHNDRIIGQGTSDATVFSFYANKTLTTGEGGMVTFPDPAVARLARTLRLHGISRDVFSRSSQDRHWEYEVVAAGFKANMSDIVASIGLVQLQRVWIAHARRKQLWERYKQALDGLPIVPAPDAAAGDAHAMHLYAIRLTHDAPLGRDAFVREMSHAGITCGVHFIPLHLHHYWRERLGLEPRQFPSAQNAFECEVTLPLFTSLTDDKQGFVLDHTRRLLS